MTLSGIQGVLFPGPTTRVVIQFILFVIVAWFFVELKNMLISTQFEYKKILINYSLYSIFVFAHSFFVADSYEQWRYLFTVYMPTLLLPGFCILGTSAQFSSVFIKTLLRVVFPISLIFNIAGASDKNSNLVYINFVGFIYLFILFIPMMRLRWKLVIFALSVLSLIFDMDNRSNMLGIFVSYGFVVLYLVLNKLDANLLPSQARRYFGVRYILPLLRQTFLYAPMILLMLGFFGVFNVFQSFEQSSELVIIESSESGRMIGTDSRTLIYKDALNNLENQNSWLWGSSATVLYTTSLAETNEGYDDGRLGGSESGFIGYLTFGGIIYAGLMFLLCLKSSYLALYKSNNLLMKILGIYISFRWLFLFIENPLELNFYWVSFFWTIGMAFSSNFRGMSNVEIKEYFFNLFEKKTLSNYK